MIFISKFFQFFFRQKFSVGFSFFRNFTEKKLLTSIYQSLIDPNNYYL
ncbi:hypothetical protein FDUTEX481_02341 [Tolypothrix sp. PCC 7601]|nr:hypothetical protein FDUTEX481_02341 [Tolypothrix sp. PCC 7601]